MEVSSTAESPGIPKEPVVPTSNHETETSVITEISDIDPIIRSETEAVLRKIVNTIEKYAARKIEPIATAPARPFIKLNVGIDNLQTKGVKEQDTAVVGSSKVEQSATAIKTAVKQAENNTESVDDFTVINNETKECTVLPFVPLNLNPNNEIKKILEQNNEEIVKVPRKVTPKLLVDNQIDACYKGTNSASVSKIGDASVKIIKQNPVTAQKPPRKIRRPKQPSSVIDQLFDAARKGDKNDFKRILYVNYDNIVNDYIDNDNSTQSDSNASTSEEIAEVKETVELCDSQATDTAPDTEPLAGTSTESDGDDEGIGDLDSKLVICEKDNKKGSEVLKQNKKRVPNFKEISRKVAAKKFKTGTEASYGVINSENGANNSGQVNANVKVDQNKNYTSDFVDVVNIKQEPDTEDYFASSELDESISQSEFSADDSLIKIKIEELADFPREKDPTDETELQFICQHCTRKYRNLVHLRSHQAQHHFNETRFTCEACSEVFPSLDKLKEHEKVHVIIERNYCELCKKSYSSKPAIRRHAETVHVVEKQRPHQCDICDFAFTCRWHLREHLRIHTGEWLFESLD